jgi:hypothetical protein
MSRGPRTVFRSNDTGDGASWAKGGGILAIGTRISAKYVPWNGTRLPKELHHAVAVLLCTLGKP